MTMRRIATVALTILGVTGPLVWAQARGQNPPPASPAPGAPAAPRADAYYNVTMGHLYQQEFENAGHAEDAAKAIDFYKKAYALDPNSPEIGEDLAEIYFLSHRSGDAINEAQELIRRNPNDLSARRLLARIYIRSLGDLTNPTEQQQTITAAIAQLQEIVKLDPSDNEAALWLARLLRLNNHDDQAEQVLRGILAKDADNKGAVDQLSLLLLDHNESDAAISLLESFLQQAPSADLYDRLGDAYEQVQQTSKAEAGLSPGGGHGAGSDRSPAASGAIALRSRQVRGCSRRIPALGRPGTGQRQRSFAHVRDLPPLAAVRQGGGTSAAGQEAGSGKSRSDL